MKSAAPGGVESGNRTILRRSDDKDRSFFCCNANNGIHGCTNRDYKSARIIDGVFAPNNTLRSAVTALAIGNVGKRRDATA